MCYLQLPFNIELAKSLPVKLSISKNCKKFSCNLLFSSIYRTHILSCSLVEMSVVSSARTEKHLDLLITLTLVSLVKLCYMTELFHFV